MNSGFIYQSELDQSDGEHRDRHVIPDSIGTECH